MVAARWRQRVRMVVALLLGVAAALLARWADGRAGLSGLADLLRASCTLVLAGLLFWIQRRPAHGELRLDEPARTYYVPPRAGVSSVPLWTGFSAYAAVDIALDTGHERWRLGLAAFSGLVAVGTVLLGWRRAPGVELTPDGVTHRHLEREVFVPWAALDPVGRVGSGRGFGAISLPVQRPELLRGSGWGRNREQVATTELDLAPTRLAAVLRHYVTHPEDRAAIGTREELARLRQLLGDPA
ncbi:hypothetical protein GA0070564_101817 [Micromonospora mirobrigensis]|uniref:PH domain-containing protein n=2 Tax=Micromonospora mirobrigensis TaxID=262898 RepID=A0A1C4UYM0_9ACTN|nr:hypothetical protein GA0070564_101817 [Micromonospora mirobrigensis]